MKLRNKRTGEIIEFDAILPVKDVAGDSVAHLEYDSLAELNAEWEDYEEPKEYWYICSTRNYEITRVVLDKGTDFDRVQKDKDIGNYFETEEEAERAREKLKAWKRLKDKGFKFTAWCGSGNNIKYEITSLENTMYIPRQLWDDLDTIFGGEE